MTQLARSHDLDWLRLLAGAVLIAFHTAAVFYEGELGSFYVHNAVSSAGLSLFIQFVHQWHMPLFFFLAGAASWYSLQTRSQGEYVRHRLQSGVPWSGVIPSAPPPRLRRGGQRTSGDRLHG
jgi:glucans biosynthesis protein C